ncbi:nucleotidyltransferase domain-containing protein [Clostridium sp. MSJ-4]|uniref:Nucleotidyltransferase domain-containing protein n=1 Tax=Clostridium simiarum TaxID=2841506 RepID=A0ABS6EXQ0_9CLOT|nr:nucleotidyltransferase domain-containing protein [Clostridium simiarum]MBU5590987.1 nucleotidyltransferase domain-containing protein [Clostridium simiarum]
MENIILKYQKAFNSLVDKMRSNENILAVMVFGSMVTGDFWEESDIDLFVILKDEIYDIRNIYTEEKEVAVHIKLMSKEKFLQLHESDLRGGFIHRIFASSRLVFSKDLDITTRYNNGRYYPDLDREKWNMVYLGRTLKSLGVCKKYLTNDGIYTAFTTAVRSIEDFARLYVNCNGYMISKDATSMAMNLNDDFKKCVDELFFNKNNVVEAIENALEFLKESIDKNIKQSTRLLMEFMREKDKFLSAEDIKRDPLFENFDIEIEEVLNELWKRNLIKKDSRDYKNSEGNVIIKENVYFI